MCFFMLFDALDKLGFVRTDIILIHDWLQLDARFSSKYLYIRQICVLLFQIVFQLIELLSD